MCNVKCMQAQYRHVVNTEDKFAAEKNNHLREMKAELRKLDTNKKKYYYFSINVSNDIIEGMIKMTITI